MRLQGQGTNFTVEDAEELKRNDWITAPRNLIRRFAAKAGSPLMATVLSVRLTDFQPPFACTAVPFLIILDQLR